MSFSVSFYTASFYSLVLLFVRVLIHPLFLTLTPSSLLPTWHTLPLLDLFHLLSWKRWPIRFRHLNVDARGFTCSITVLVDPLASLLTKLWFHEKLQCSRETLETVPAPPFSHEPTPILFSNLIDMKESANKILEY